MDPLHVFASTSSFSQSHFGDIKGIMHMHFFSLGLGEEKLRKFVSSGLLFDSDGTSDTVFLIRRSDVDDLQMVTLEPITSSVEKRFKTQFEELELVEQIRLYQYLANMRGSSLALLVSNETLEEFLDSETEQPLWKSTLNGQLSSSLAEASRADSDREDDGGDLAGLGSVGPEVSPSPVSVDFQLRDLDEYEGSSLERQL
jgi:hypothetical protein